MNAFMSAAVQNSVKISIIIPVYNAEDFLTDTFESILSQNIDPNLYEVIVIDDGSRDSSLEIIRSFEKKFTFFKYLTQPNGGVSVARNRGLDLIAGEYVMFLDSDDTLKPTVLCKILLLTTGDDDADIYFFGQNYSSQLKIYELDQFLSSFYFSVYVWKTCIKASLIREKHLRFSEGFILEDGIFLLEAIIKASKIGTLKLDLVSYNTNKKSLTRDYSCREKNLKMISSFVFIISKYQELIFSVQENISSKAYDNLMERKESFIFFMFFRMIRYKFSRGQVEENFRKVNFSGRFMRFPGVYHNKAIYKLLAPAVANRPLRTVFAATARLIKPEMITARRLRIKTPVFLRHIPLLKLKEANA